jgi:hypothetical protein
VSLPEKPAVAAHVSDNAENGLDVIQRSNLMDNFVIWRPERDGHAPPFWQDGMESSYTPLGLSWTRKWDKGGIYRVPPEAVNGPLIDDARNDAEFDVQAWLAQGRANADKLPAGVVLPEPTDWADKLAKEWRETPLCESLGLADFIRTHCQPREVSNG